jgi:hypothetical protein
MSCCERRRDGRGGEGVLHGLRGGEAWHEKGGIPGVYLGGKMGWICMFGVGFISFASWFAFLMELTFVSLAWSYI